MQAQINLIKRIMASPPWAVLKRVESEYSQSTGRRNSGFGVERAGEHDMFDGLHEGTAQAVRG
jgi:hypothetical protein